MTGNTFDKLTAESGGIIYAEENTVITINEAKITEAYAK